MSLTLGYRIPGSSRGAVFTVPDTCHGYVSSDEAERIACEMRASGMPVTWQKVRSIVILRAERRAAQAQRP